MDEPYGCLFDRNTKYVFYFNRNYKPLGDIINNVVSSLTGLNERLYFYNDGKLYREGLAIFDGYTKIYTGAPTVAFDKSIP